jgi:hypothetical protein
MDHFDGGSLDDRNPAGGKSKVVRIDIVPADGKRREHSPDDGREVRLYEFLDEYESFLHGAELTGHGGLNSCRAVVPLLKALEAANEMASCMKISKRPKESWKLSLLRAEVLKCVMNAKALSKRLEQYHSLLGPGPAPPSA